MCERARAISGNRIPKRGATEGETDEPFDTCGSGKPASHPGFIGTPAQHDAANPVAPVAARCGHDTLAIVTVIPAFNLSDSKITQKRLVMLKRTKLADIRQVGKTAEAAATVAGDAPKLAQPPAQAIRVVDKASA